MDRIPVASPLLGEEEAQAAHETVRQGWITMGAKTRAFEDAVAALTGARHAIAMNSGTATLHCLLAAHGIGPGDEVIIPAMTYISTVNAVLYVGATPVLADSEAGGFNLTADTVRPLITARTRAIMPVDMNGVPPDYDALAALAAEHGIPVLADSAEALGARYRGRPVGIQAQAHSFSFFANKSITTGEGGMVVTDDDALADELRILRNQGQEGRYHHTRLGFNYRMPDILSAIGLVQAGRAEGVVAAKATVARRYDQAFAAMPGVTAARIPDWAQSSWYLYVILVAPELRDPLAAHLDGLGIETRLSFPPVTIQPYHARRFGWSDATCPQALATFRRLLDIPIWPGLPEADQDRIVEAIFDFIAKRGPG
ncbi:DegT/DnrJ/EryC1/StrS family aminotransferase [Paramagnetospirillum kuznetsovii]|nr:DegT/DnrJ/EryC1/StrS family aminotransferase [Paramagnetospirillum kuznetsovii]